MSPVNVVSNPLLLSVVVPAYNEELRLPDTLTRIFAYLARQPYHSEVIVADDGSADRIAALAERIADRHANLRLLRRDHCGKGFAVRAGALASRGEYVLLCDAGLAVPIEEWERLQRFLSDGYDVAIGSREGLGARREGEPWYRHVMGARLQPDRPPRRGRRYPGYSVRLQGAAPRGRLTCSTV